MNRLAIAFFLMLLPTAACATVLDIFGAESGDMTTTTQRDGEIYAGCGGDVCAIESTTKRTGSYSVKIATAGNQNGYFQTSSWDANGASASSSSYVAKSVRFYFYYTTKPAANDEEIMWWDTSGTDVSIRLNSSGQLALYSGAGSPTTLVATGTTALSSSTWYRIAFRTNASNSWSVKIDGATEISGTNNYAASGRILFGKVLVRNTQPITVYYDDVYVDNADTDIPAGGVTQLLATGDGSYTAWIAGAGSGDYTALDEAAGDPATDTNTTYSVTSTQLDAESVNVTDTATAGISGTINAVKALVWCYRNDANTTNIKVRIRSGSTDSDTTGGSNPNASQWTTRALVLDLDPADSAAWTTSDVDGAQVGVQHAQAQTRELWLTKAVLMVDWAASTVTMSNPGRQQVIWWGF